MLRELLDRPITQAEFAGLIGVSEAKVSQLRADGVIAPGQTAAEWLLAYCSRLREVAAGRAGSGDLDLVQERAALAREQRLSVAIKNAVARREYAPVGVLAQTLAAASASVAALMEQLPGRLRRVAPNIDDDARRAIDDTLADARNEWVAATAALRLVAPAPDDDAEDAAGGEGPGALADEAAP